MILSQAANLPPETAEIYPWLRYIIFILGGALVTTVTVYWRGMQTTISELRTQVQKQNNVIDTLTNNDQLLALLKKQEEEINRLRNVEIESQKLIAQKYEEMTAIVTKIIDQNKQ